MEKFERAQIRKSNISVRGGKAIGPNLSLTNLGILSLSGNPVRPEVAASP